jgi:hypothetical protein
MAGLLLSGKNSVGLHKTITGVDSLYHASKFKDNEDKMVFQQEIKEINSTQSKTL